MTDTAKRWSGTQMAGRTFEKEDFSGHDLSKMKVSHAVFHNCNFDGANMMDSEFEYCDFSGSSMRDTNCYGTSFKRSKLQATVFSPRDAYGMTITFDCYTVRGMQLSQNWWYFWLAFISLTNPEAHPVKEPLKDQLIAAIGAERYVRLKTMLESREL